MSAGLGSPAQTAASTFMFGRWGDALRLCDELIARSESGRRKPVDPNVFSLRATIRLGYGDATGADADSERAIDLAEASGTEARTAALCVRTAVHLDAG